MHDHKHYPRPESEQIKFEIDDMSIYDQEIKPYEIDMFMKLNLMR